MCNAKPSVPHYKEVFLRALLGLSKLIGLWVCSANKDNLMYFCMHVRHTGPPSIARLVGIATAGGLALLGILTSIFILLRARRKGRGNKLPYDFFKGSMRSMMSWKRQQVLAHGGVSPSMATSAVGLLQDLMPSPSTLPGTHEPDRSRGIKMDVQPLGITTPST